MLQGFVRSTPFLLIRTIIVAAEGAALLISSIYVHAWFMEFMSGYVEGLFLTLLNPVGIILGVGIGALISKYPLGIVKYYFKLAHIIYLTSLILEYKPKGVSRFLYSLQEATTNFALLALNDFTTRTVVKALGALKDAIVTKDLMSRFKETEGVILKFVRQTLTTGIANVIDMTDEIIVSYTWFTNDLWLESRRKKKLKAPSIKMKAKNTAMFMLEGMAFTVRVMPQLLVNSIIYEVAFVIFANASIVLLLLSGLGYFGFSWWHIFYFFIVYKLLVRLFYYVIIESLRLVVYLTAFYNELGELEPFDIKSSIGGLLGKVPLLAPLVKASKQDIQPTGSPDSPILEGDLNQLMKDNVKGVATAFNLKTDDLVEEQEQEEEEEEEFEPTIEKEKQEPEAKGEEEEIHPDPEEEEEEEVEVEVEIDLEDNPSPFDSMPKIHRRDI